jgi:crotonobetainyl-CoA:carnitine CoA-transferase CaiB-like acyl-CoA transferase
MTSDTAISLSAASISRRDLLQGSGALALAAAAGAALAGPAGAQAADDFDIDAAFATFMADLGQGAGDGGGTVTFTGRDPIVRSHFHLGASMAIPAMGAGVGAAAIWQERTGEGQDVSVDLRESIYNIMPVTGLILQMKQAFGIVDPDDPIPSTFEFVPTINGGMFQAPLLMGSPMSFAIFETKDGRHVTPTGLYPHHFHGILNILGVPPDAEAIKAAIKTWNAEDFDQAMADGGFASAIHRTAEEWAAHPEGMHLSGTPLIEIVKVADGDPVPWPGDPVAPLSGLKVLANTHVIAGSTAARTLSEYGADVLHIARDQSFEHEIIWTDINIGMRSSFLNLRADGPRAVMQGLTPQADVFIESFRGRSMERLGFGVEEMSAGHKGLVYLSMRCYSWDGPWSNRAGFDMEALTTSGFTMAEGRGGMPRFPPTMVLNDYIAGYLGAAGIIAALRRRASEGGSYHVRVNLTRAAMWYASLGQFETLDFDATDPDHAMIMPRTIMGQTPYGAVHRLAPQVVLSKTPGQWPDQLLHVRGGNLPEWGNRT